jgi:hypothetical protein
VSERIGSTGAALETGRLLVGDNVDVQLNVQATRS